jgi:hypothetical protein
MNLESLEAALHAADPTTGHEPLPSAATTIAEARRRASAHSVVGRQPRQRRLVLAIVAAGVIAGAAAGPVMSRDHAPHAAAIQLVAFTPPRSIELPFGLAIAPAGWHIAAAKGIGGNDSVVALAPAGKGPTDRQAIQVAKYAKPRPAFPAGWECQGPVTAVTSNGRATSLMRGTCLWQAQVALADGSVFYVQAPPQMTEEQVRAFLDGLSAG